MLGVAAVWFLQGLLQPLVFGIEPRSPQLLVLVSLVVIGLATIAAIAPAVRAMRVDVRRSTVLS